MNQSASVISPTNKRRENLIVFYRDGHKIFDMKILSATDAAKLRQAWIEGATQAGIAEAAQKMGLL